MIFVYIFTRSIVYSYYTLLVRLLSSVLCYYAVPLTKTILFGCYLQHDGIVGIVLNVEHAVLLWCEQSMLIISECAGVLA